MQFRCHQCDQRVPQWVVRCGYCGQPARPDVEPPGGVVLLTRVKRRPSAQDLPRASPIALFPRRVEPGRGADNFYCGFERRLRSGGVFVATPRPYGIGSLVQISFSLPGWTAPLAAIGRVHWVREHAPGYVEGAAGMGLVLGGLPPGAEREIDEFIRRREPIFYEGQLLGV